VPTVANPASFREEARWQTVCAYCGKTGPFQAHHVVDKAILRDRCQLSGNALYDTRNALRLCEGLDTARCHFQFENRRIRIRTTMLTDDNIAYAFEVLGPYAYDYLRQEYAYVPPDPRIELALASTLVI
jgi:hypothetical protein